MNISFILILFVIIAIAAIFFMKKKKNSFNNGGEVIKRRAGDEVWSTIKRFLRENSELGKEIVESYVAKRPDPTVINRMLPKNEQKLQKIAIKKQKKEEKQKAAEAKKQKIPYVKPKNREIYVVLFVTKNPKTNIEDKPRAIECEVKNVKVAGKKKNFEKKIEILGEKDYETESKWILPIKAAEEKQIIKEQKRSKVFKKLNLWNMYQTKKMEKLKKDEHKFAAYNKKQELKKQKKEKKIQKEHSKWAKKEKIVSTKK